MPDPLASVARVRALFPPDAFSREDESDDAVFYRTDRFVPHLDAVALETVRRVVGTLVTEASPAVLDLMASWDSHLPEGMTPSGVVGLGMNQNELDRNTALTERVIHDLNADPRLPFEDGIFDVVLNTVSVDYLVKPFEVFSEVARVLKPGGLFLVIFSSRFFEAKAIKLWRDGSELERQLLVEDYFRSAPDMAPFQLFVSRGRPRPDDDKYAASGLPSDPIWAMYAEKKGGHPDRPRRPAIPPDPDPCPPADVIAERKRHIHETYRCPYCERALSEWEVSDTPFNEWDVERVWVCFNNQCPYLISGWDEMSRQGNYGFSYRLMYVSERDRCYPTPIAGLKADDRSRVTPRG